MKRRVIEGSITLEDQVVRAALAWWESKRPDEYDEAEHLTDAEVNCDGDFEKKLAREVANLVFVKARQI